jgi:hypothetical protein
LAEEEPVFESEFSEREADDKALPWEEWPVQPARQALVVVSLACTYMPINYSIVPEELPES